jgi:glucose-6-phosphate 1-epimerase
MQTTQALHTYFCVSDIGRVSVTGLESNSYLDNLADRIKKEATGAPITISEEVDRIYTNTGAEALSNEVCLCCQQCTRCTAQPCSLTGQ